MNENFKWLFWRSGYCLLFAQAYWWKLGTFSLLLFWGLTSYLLMNAVYLLIKLNKNEIKIHYNFAFNSILDIFPAMVVIATVSMKSILLSSVVGLIYGAFFVKACNIIRKKDYRYE